MKMAVLENTRDEMKCRGRNGGGDMTVADNNYQRF